MFAINRLTNSNRLTLINVNRLLSSSSRCFCQLYEYEKRYYVDQKEKYDTCGKISMYTALFSTIAISYIFDYNCIPCLYALTSISFPLLIYGNACFENRDEINSMLTTCKLVSH